MSDVPTTAAAGSPEMPILRLDQIDKSFGRLQVLRDVSLDVQKGEVVCIIRSEERRVGKEC